MVSIRASVVASKVRYVEHVKADAHTSAMVSLGPRLHTNTKTGALCFTFRSFCFRASSGQLTCYFGGLDQAKRTLNQSLNDQTCAVKYSNRMNLTDGSSINTTYRFTFD